MRNQKPNSCGRGGLQIRSGRPRLIPGQAHTIDGGPRGRLPRSTVGNVARARAPGRIANSSTSSRTVLLSRLLDAIARLLSMRICRPEGRMRGDERQLASNLPTWESAGVRWAGECGDGLQLPGFHCRTGFIANSLPIWYSAQYYLTCSQVGYLITTQCTEGVEAKRRGLALIPRAVSTSRTFYLGEYVSHIWSTAYKLSMPSMPWPHGHRILLPGVCTTNVSAV